MTDEQPSRTRLVRDLIVFQFKLALDGLRDVLLSPVSLGAALLGILTSRDDPGKYFRRLMELGRASDRWINLFNSHNEEDRPSSDTLVRQAEAMVAREFPELLQGDLEPEQKNRPAPRGSGDL